MPVILWPRAMRACSNQQTPFISVFSNKSACSDLRPEEGVMLQSPHTLSWRSTPKPTLRPTGRHTHLIRPKTQLQSKKQTNQDKFKRNTRMNTQQATMPSLRLLLTVTILAVIHEAELSRLYRLCLRSRSRAFALRRRIPRSVNRPRERLRDLLRLLAAVQEARERTREHTALLRLWHLVGDINHLPHRQWLE